MRFWNAWPLLIAGLLMAPGCRLPSLHAAPATAAVEAARAGTDDRPHVVASTVIAQLHGEMRANLEAELRFNGRLRTEDG